MSSKKRNSFVGHTEPASACTSTESDAEPEFALSIRQPFAELIMRGVKTFEHRRRLTHKRGRIWIYASLGRWRAGEATSFAEEYGLDVNGLPRGVLVGTVELFDCEENGGEGGFIWKLKEAKRASGEMKRPAKHPMPVWFRPF